MTTENPTVAANAVIPDTLPMHELTLIGIMQDGTASRALVRSARGDISTVTTGDTIGSKTVAVISKDGLILAAADGRQTVLQMPS